VEVPEFEFLDRNENEPIENEPIENEPLPSRTIRSVVV
jgi:hypothetical protein